MMRVGRCAGNSSTRCAGSGPKASLTIASVERYLAAAGASWRRGLSVNVSGASIFTSLPRIVPVSRDHFVGDAHHTGYSLGQVNERGALRIGADEPPKMVDAIFGDRVAVTEIGSVLLVHARQQSKTHGVVGIQVPRPCRI